VSVRVNIFVDGLSAVLFFNRGDSVVMAGLCSTKMDKDG
jgi:hypothetical protein